MNLIFKTDTELIRAISNKKVYPNCKSEVLEIVKNSSVQPLKETKENEPLPIAKKIKNMELGLEKALT